MDQDIKDNIATITAYCIFFTFVILVLTKLFQEEKYQMLLNAFEKDKLQRQYQNTLECLEIGIITKSNNHINYFNSKGISFLSQEAFRQQNNEYASMLNDLREKIKKFEINWEVDENHLQVQQDIDQNKTFRIYKEEVDKQSNSSGGLQKQKYSLQDIEAMT